MKKHQIIISLIFAASFIMITSCSKDEQIDLQNRDKSTSINKEDILSKLAEQGIDVSKEFMLGEKAVNVQFLEGYKLYKMQYQENWTSTNCRFNSSFCAPDGKDYRINFYIYSSETGTTQFIKNITKHCWTAGEKIGLTPYYICGGNYQDVIVLATFYCVTSGQGGGTYVGYALSNIVEDVPLDGISIP